MSGKCLNVRLMRGRCLFLIQTQEGKEVDMSVVRVGQKAPDFEAPAYQDGKFGQVKLSDYLGKWVVLCFYPGDFTFV